MAQLPFDKVGVYSEEAQSGNLIGCKESRSQK